MKLMQIIIILTAYLTIIIGQSQTTNTYINPVIPGDHPDPTLTRIGKDFYTSGSSFNPTPKIYHSTDLVHWEVIAQPVSASWSLYGNTPGGGIWGGHMVLYNDKYWHFFGRGGGSMYFVTALKPEGPWSDPIQVLVPSGLDGLGVDNSIFIDDDNSWYLLTKAGRENNHIVELGVDGQPTGKIFDLTWLNPAPDYPYNWAEGPVMWKNKGYYYYSFAQHLAGNQYVMRSDTLTEDELSWTVIGTNIFTGPTGVFRTPNHISPSIMLDDGTSWIVAQSYRDDWYAQGRQGLVCELVYDDNDMPKILRPSIDAKAAPDLPNGGIPWMVPHSDMFVSENLNPEWSFLGYTPESTHSLTERPGWLKLSIYGRVGKNTIIKNDGEHNYSLITKIDFEPESAIEEAGLWMINGPETHKVKVYSTVNSENKKVFVFSFEDTEYEVENSIGPIVWLKLIRDEHNVYGYYSPDGFSWFQIGEHINASAIDFEQTQFNDFTGNQQGLFVKNSAAYFDLYIYRDAYSPISAANPANHYGTKTLINRYPPNSLSGINDGDWVLYAGVEFGNKDYPKQADSISITASSDATGGIIDVLLDSLSGTKIAELQIDDTGDWDDYRIFTTAITKKISGCHDVYLRFKGSYTELFRLQKITFIETDDAPTSTEYKNEGSMPMISKLMQNYPNPFNPKTIIKYFIPKTQHISIKVYNSLGRKVATLTEGIHEAGEHSVNFDGSRFSSGVYLYQMKTTTQIETKKFLLLK